MRGAWMLALVTACNLPVGMMAAETTAAGPTSSEATSASASSTATTNASTSTTTADTSGRDDASSSTDPPSLFIVDPDGGGREYECDLWNDECPRGEKCMPWANDGGNSWNATRCAPLDPNPAQVGEPCTVEESGVSGIDTCAQYSMCWDVDPDTNTGECVAFCMGSRANPTCPEGTECKITNSAPLILCLPYCDPLLQDCNEGQACYPVVDGFACGFDASGVDGQLGDPCRFLNVCDPGLFCANADSLPGCSASGCCTPFCDTSDTEASGACDATVAGTACVGWYERGQAPPGFENVGGCTTPQ